MFGWELAKYGILEAVMKEFIARGLDKVYDKQIKEWKKYQKEKKWAKKLDKRIDKHKENAIKLFEEEIKEWKPKELEEIVWDIIPQHTTTN